jgi:hypothetical protein
MRALGTEVAGVFGNHQPLVQRLLVAADRTDEPLWQLSLDARYRKQLESDVADLRNIGAGAPGEPGAITAALFLAEFVDGTPWGAPRHRRHGAEQRRRILASEGRHRLRRPPADRDGAELRPPA